MKTSKTILKTICILQMLPLFCGLSQIAYADDPGFGANFLYQEVCLQPLEQGEPGNEYLKLGIKKLRWRGVRYLVNGEIIDLVTNDVSLLHGTMQMVGGEWIIHFTNSRIIGQESVVSIGTIVLASDMLTGFVRGMSMSGIPDTDIKDFGAFFVEVNHIACP